MGAPPVRACGPTCGARVRLQGCVCGGRACGEFGMCACVHVCSIIPVGCAACTRGVVQTGPRVRVG
eukprot:2483646-Prymnesium_polylepis.1